MAALILGMPMLGITHARLGAQPPKGDGPKAKGKGEPSRAAPVKTGLAVNDPKACRGYTLIAPLNSSKTYLVDLQGRVVRTWKSDTSPGCSAYLLDNGNLLRPGVLRGEKLSLGGPGAGGRVQEFTWDGELVWDFKFSNDRQLPHHDICRLPNGNVLLIAWERKTAKEAVAAGRRPDTVGEGGLLPDCLLEIKPTGKTTGKVVWEWHIWDHLVQDHDKSKANFGNVAEHPELIDVNFSQNVVAPMLKKKDDADKLRSIGYLGRGRGPVNPDWTHTNSVAYNPELDQIALTIHSFSEVWIIDHSTTAAEAAGHKGGRWGRGGDLLYRWGNPRAYRAGGPRDQKLFAPHNAQWVPKGYPGEGHLIVFNNGMRRPDGSYSTVDEIVPPWEKGQYVYSPGNPYGPEKPVWSYAAPKKSDFYSFFISGAHRLPNGNTLICSGVNGTVFEVTPDKEVVWKYINPARSEPGMGPGGPGGPPGPGGFRPGGFRRPQAGEILPGFLQDILGLKEEQKKQLADFQKEARGKLDKLLTEPQRKQLADLAAPRGPGGFGGAPRPGEILTAFQQARLKLTAEQKKELAALQKQADSTLEKTLDAAQKKQLQQMRDAFGRGGFGGPPGGPPGRGGFGGPGGGSSLFRSYRYAADHPGLAGKELKPGKTIEELEQAESKAKKKDK
jgi:hypothetical protein